MKTQSVSRLSRTLPVGILLFCFAASALAQGALRVTGTKVFRKVVAALDNIVATTAKGSGSTAFKMPVLKPFFVLADEGEYLKITDQQEGGGHIGFAKKSQVLEWSTREGLHFQPSMLSLGDRPQIKVWKDRATIEQFARTGNSGTFGPSYVEEKVTTRALPSKLLPYPVLGSAKLKTIAGSEKTIFRVLIPAYTEAATVQVPLTGPEIREVLSKVTFCVVFDATASMEEYAESMAATIEELLRGVAPGVDVKDLSVGFIFFRDLEDKQPLSIVNPAPLEAAVSRLRAEAAHMVGGGDAAEPVLDAATIAATEFNWSSGSGQEGGKRVAIIVLNDDAKTATIGLSPKVGKGLATTEVADLLRKRNISVYALQAGPADRGSLALTLRQLADKTGGEYFPYGEDSMKVSRAFTSHVKNLMKEKLVEAGEEARGLMEEARPSLPGDREYTTLPLNPDYA